MASTCVGHDGKHRVAVGGNQPRAGCEVDVALLANGVLEAVAIGVVGCVVEESVDCLVAFEIDNAKYLTSFDLMNPRYTRGDDLAVEGLGWIEAAGDEFSAGHCVVLLMRLQKVALRQREAAGILRTREAAWIVGRRRRNSLDGELHGFGLVACVWIERVLTGVQNGQHVHLGPQFDKATGLRGSGLKMR